MAAQLPKVQRASSRPRTVVYVLAGVAIVLLSVVAVLLLRGGLLTDEPTTSAERDYQILLEAAKENPKDPAVLMTLAEAEYEIGKKADALVRAEAAVKFAEKQPGFRLRFANLLIKDNQLDKARIQAQAEIDLATPGDPEPFFLLAQIERADGKLEEAEQLVSMGLAIAPTAADMRILYGDILAEQGKKELAAEQYRQALRFLPNDQRAIDGLTKLGEEVPVSTETTSPHGGDSQ